MKNKKSLLLRLDPVLWKKIEKWAEDESRSVNGQMEYLLKQAVSKREETLGSTALPADDRPS